MPTIRDIRVILTRPATQDLVVVKLETSEPELFGLGCATFTQRYLAVAAAIKQHLKPLLLGRDVNDIEDLWRLMMANSYWRNGPVLNNAVAGVDIALWDIKARLANMPLCDMLGGRARPAAAIYRHATAINIEDLEQQIHAFLEQGVRHVRVQLGSKAPPDGAVLEPSVAAYGGFAYAGPRPDGAAPGTCFDPRNYINLVVKTLHAVRDRFGDDIELLHDVHERLAPAQAIELHRRLESVNLFFLEDPLPPEHLDWFPRLREAATTPLAMGELFVHPQEWLPLVSGRLIDFIRMHISAIGGITPARKAAATAELHGVRTAWHGPKDVSPVGHAANVHLDTVAPNFGIQEFMPFTPLEQDMFPGCPDLREGYLYPSDKPGLGIGIDEDLAARHPCKLDVIQWTQSRRPDGSHAWP